MELRLRVKLTPVHEERLEELKVFFGVKTNAAVFRKLLEIKI